MEDLDNTHSHKNERKEKQYKSVVGCHSYLSQLFRVEGRIKFEIAITVIFVFLFSPPRTFSIYSHPRTMYPSPSALYTIRTKKFISTLKSNSILSFQLGNPFLILSHLFAPDPFSPSPNPHPARNHLPIYHPHLPSPNLFIHPTSEQHFILSLLSFIGSDSFIPFECLM